MAKRPIFYNYLILFFLWTAPHLSMAYTANKVWFEKWPKGIYRVYINYTVPALKEFREAFVEFYRKDEAEAFYWKVVQGADFYLDSANNVEFKNPQPKPEPW